MIMDILCADEVSKAHNSLNGDSISVFLGSSGSAMYHRALHTFHRKNVKPVLVVGHLVLGLASGLEAFSREPPCGSFGALAFRQTPETRGTAWEFLSYYPILPSRYLRDPFTISRLFRFHNTLFWTPLPSTRRRSRAQKQLSFALRE